MIPAITLMGCRIDNLSMEETLGRIADFIRSGQPHQHVVVNVDKLVKASRDAGLRRIINSCALVNVDGMPVVWASRLLGKPLKERVVGVDLFEALMRRSAERGWRVFLLGARADVVEAVADTYARRYPGLVVAGWRDGYWQGEREEAAVAEQVRVSRADLLFVAISSPRKEQFLGRWQTAMRIPFAMGVGGGLRGRDRSCQTGAVVDAARRARMVLSLPSGTAPHVPSLFHRRHGLRLAPGQGSAAHPQGTNIGKARS